MYVHKNVKLSKIIYHRYLVSKYMYVHVKCQIIENYLPPLSYGWNLKVWQHSNESSPWVHSNGTVWLLEFIFLETKPKYVTTQMYTF